MWAELHRPETILDPTGRDAGVVEGSRAARLPTLNGKTLGLLDNGKPNAFRLLHELADELGRAFRLRDVLVFTKPTSGTPVEQTQMEEILAACDFAVVALGD
jgi:hypothetical protein